MDNLENKDGKNFGSGKLILGETTRIIKAIDGAPGTEPTEPVCDYFISRAGENAFVEAACVDSNPCRGLCREPKTIVDLEPNTTYDIKVVAFAEYGSTVFSEDEKSNYL